MAKKYLDYEGLLYFWQKIKGLFISDVSYDSSTRRIKKTKGGSTADVVSLSTVATSGSYTDLSNKPTIPTSFIKEINLGDDVYISPDSNNRLGFSVSSPISMTSGNNAISLSAESYAAASGGTAKSVVTTGEKYTWNNKVDKVSGKGLSTNDYTTDEKNKLSGIAAGAEVNQNAFSSVLVGTTSIAADDKQDHFELAAGSNVTLTPATTSSKITIAATDTTYSVVTAGTSTTAGGLMSQADKTKLNGIASGAEVNQNAFSNVKIGSTTISADSKTDTLNLVAGDNISFTTDSTNDKITIAATDTTYSDFSGATTSAAGTHGLVPAPAQMASGGDIKLITNRGGWETVSFGIYIAGGTTTNERGLSISFNNGSSTTSLQYNIAEDTALLATSARNGFMSSADKGKLDKLVFDSSNKIDSSILPSYVDDVIEAYPRSGQTALSSTWLATGSASGTVITPETGKIYVLMADSGDYTANTQFRWGGTAYVKLSDGGVSSITNSEIDTIVAS